MCVSEKLSGRLFCEREREALLHRRGVRSFILGEGERMPNVLECRGGERTLREFSLEVL